MDHESVVLGVNQYIIQRALAAKSNRYAQKGIVFAALIAAIVSSLASMTNSIATIFLLAIFWKKTTANGALSTAIGSAVFSMTCILVWSSCGGN